MSLFDIATKLHRLASLPANRTTLAKDASIVASIVTFAEAETADIARLGLEAAAFLMQDPAAKKLLSAETLSQLSTALSPKLAGNTDLANLQQSIVALTTEPGSKKRSRTPLASPAVVTPAKKGPARTRVFSVETLDDTEAQEIIEDALLRTAGVISFWVDVPSSEVTVRSRLAVDTVVEVIRTAGFDEVKHIPKARSKSGSDGYQSEDEENRGQAHGSGGWLGTIVTWGSKVVAADADKPTAEGKQAGWLGSWW